MLFTSDNGPTHGRVGGSDSAFFRSAGELRGLKGSVYEGGLRVPLIVRWPGRVPAGETSDHLAYFPDLLPTLMDLIGATDLVPDGIDGLSFAPTLLGRRGEQPEHAVLYWEFAGYGGQQAVRVGKWKGVRQNLAQGASPVELYDLEADPTESKDVAGENPGVVAGMTAIMQDQHARSELFPLPSVDPGAPKPKAKAKKK